MFYFMGQFYYNAVSGNVPNSLTIATASVANSTTSEYRYEFSPGVITPTTLFQHFSTSTLYLAGCFAD